MGDLIQLADRRWARLNARRADRVADAGEALPIGLSDSLGPARGHDQRHRGLPDRSRTVTRFYVAIDCPLSYLAAEQVERAFGEIAWVPVLGPLSELGGPAASVRRSEHATAVLFAAEREAKLLGIPFVRPAVFPIDSRRVARVAVVAAGAGHAQRFVLAIQRLAFAGGFDMTRDYTIREAAAVAGLDPDVAAAAARDGNLDPIIHRATVATVLAGVRQPPAISIGLRWFEGAPAIREAISFRQAGSA
ncbi:MAG: DsbA family protein [Solirubrobacteraceae bacterium]